MCQCQGEHGTRRSQGGFMFGIQRDHERILVNLI
jgi:hypothetical protein